MEQVKGRRKRPVISVANDENDDWIKKILNYQQEDIKAGEIARLRGPDNGNKT